MLKLVTYGQRTRQEKGEEEAQEREQVIAGENSPKGITTNYFVIIFACG